MAVEIERLVATLEARIDKYEKNLAKARGTTEKTFTAIEKRGVQMQKKLDSTFASFGKGFVIGAAGAFGAAALSELPGTIRKIVGDAAGLVDVANKIGITTTSLQELHFAATQGGASIEDMDKALGFFAKSVGAALEGTGDLGKVLDQNGISLRDQNGKVRSASDLLRDYANLIQNAGSEQERARLTTVAFGRAGSDLANVFRDGSAGIDAAAESITKLGGVIDSETLKQIADLDDRWDALATTLDVRIRRAILNAVVGFDNLQNGSADLGDRLIDLVRALDASPFNETVQKMTPNVSPAVKAATDKIDTYRKSIENLLVAMRAIGQPLNLSVTGDAAREVLKLSDEVAKGEKSLTDFDAAMDEVSRSQPSFKPAIDALKKLQHEIAATIAGLGALTDSQKYPDNPFLRPPADRADRAKAAQQAEGVAALDQASKEARMTEGEKRLEAEMERLRKEIEKDHPGAIVSDAQIREQAQKNIGLGDLKQTIDSYVNDVVKAEGTGKNPSSSADGFGNFITSTWLDLFKRYFPDRAKGMADAAILALRHDEATGRTLIEAYARENAAVLQKAGVSVTEAALQLSHFLGAGDAAKVFKAAPGTPLKGLISQSSINANPTILGGGRTVDDAIAYAQSRVGQATPGAAKFDTNQGFDAYLAQEKQSLDMLRQEAEVRQQLGPIVEGNSAALLAFQQAQMLLGQAQQAGAAVGLELHDVNQLLYGDLTGLSPAAREQAETMRGLALDYANTQVAGEKLAEAQGRLREQADSFNEIGRDALGTFISDLREGKSAAEALGDVLDNIADKLVNMALDALFSSGAAGGGGIGGWISKLFGLKDGGMVHAARGGQIHGPGTSRSDSIPAMLSDKEFVVNAAATRKNLPLLKAINSGKPLHLAAGGLVGSSDIRAIQRTASAVSARAAGGPSLNFAPTYQIDASGSQMSEQQFRAILQENNKHVVRDVRQKVSGWVAYDQRRFGQ